MIKRLFLVSIIGLGLVLALLGLLAHDSDAAPTILRVATDCSGLGNCYTSIQDAVDAANDYDTIHVAQGVYSETVLITKSVTLEGGWNTGFSARDWDAYVTTIDARRNGPVIQIRENVSPTIEGFVITGGDASVPLGWGGGILVYGNWGGGGLVTVRHNVITDNIACQGDSCQGYGGGIMVYSSQSIIEHNRVISNVARASGSHGGTGGGIAIYGTAEATIAHNVIVSNTAVYTPTGLWEGRGGGVYAHNYGGTLQDNDIRGNVAAVGGVGRGGGVYAGGALEDNRILSNTASVNGAGYGGGVYADYVTDFYDNLVQGNVASQNDDGTGGGVWAHYLKIAERNTIVDNRASRGGGIYYTPYAGHITLRDNLIARNYTDGSASDPPDGGSGLYSLADKVEIVNNQILTNTAYGGYGGGVLVAGGSQFILQDNQVISNTALEGGGIAVYTATGAITHNRVVSNLSLIGGGMYLWGAAQPALDSNVVMSNTALGFSWAGGGVMVNVDAGLALTLTNHLIARNAAGSGGPGAGVLCWQGDCVLINNTIVDNDRGDYDEGVILGNSGYAGTYTLFNNIIAGHSTGVWLVNGAATLDYNDYYYNATNVSGATWGTHHRTDDPHFEDRAGADYHLSLTSLLVDQADGSVAPNHDYEGDPRPRGGGADIGADEAYPAQVYVSANIGNDLTGSGTSSSPYASVTKGLAEVRTGGTVYVARGQYTERITVTRSVDLLGGYHESDWSRNIATNTTTLDAQGSGTVVVINTAGTEVTVEGFEITGGEANIYGLGGGLFAADADAVTVRYNVIHGNHAQNGGGGLFVDGGTRSVIEANRIYDNVAAGVFSCPAVLSVQSPAQGPEPGGGMLVGNPAYIINNLIYNNSAVAGGDGVGLLAFGENTIQFLHNTVVDNGTNGIEIHGDGVEMYDNLAVGHGTAITGTQATWDYDGFYDNDADYGTGLSAGAHDVSGNPCFADRAGHDYHIGPGSAGAGRGSTVGVTADFDGATRPAPAGTAPDMGAYEVSQRRVYLPLVLRG